ncbi:4Fe-4S binding protein [Azoarcus sp. KH32C]|uniref:4Fe-4S binding protein n=1 Tax=Azoarcus sp. KH32C TaxID=748247 RepID=UPI000238635E|nr:4Fe-4S binding protein [Azoarcus sp. KH32C]BAL22509.1 FMN-binding domain-containing protein [Azoarcus sp. KH32C]
MARQACGFWRLWPLALLLWVVAASAGELTQADVARRFPPPLQVGAKIGATLNEAPAWPLTNELTPEAGPVGYVFESIDLAPIPGFEGTPFNLLIAIDARGDFTSVEVLRQHEPVFLSGLGEAPLHAFVAQYAGKNIKQPITVSSAYGRSSDAGGRRVVLDGVAKATASIRVVNQTVLTAALAVARAHLGLATPGRHGAVAEVRTELYENKDFAALLRDGDLIRKRWSNREVEALFAGTDAAGIDEAALAAPDDTFIDLYVGYLNAPTLGRALLGERGYAELMRQLGPGQSAYWLAAQGRHRLLGPDFVRGTMPPRLTVSQDGPLEARDADLELRPPAGAPPFDTMVVLKSPQLSGLDPGRGVNIALEVVREKGQIYPVLTRQTLDLDYTPPARYFTWPPEPLPEWLVAWKARWPELAIIAAGLLTLSLVLARPRRLAMDERRMFAFRMGFLAFTLVFVGWYAQGQLSIVQLTGAVKTLVAGQGLGSFLYDPVSLLLIAFTAISFVLWGRGTFCGWLCPFGALQEFVAVIARRLGVKNRRLPQRLESLLERGRFVVLAGLLLAAAVAPGVAEGLVEIEPFKTAITVGFDRSWPFVAWAVLLLALGGVYYKFFCRFVCPLGAAMTVGGRLRRFDWQAIRPECGHPCQTCRARCEYDAIARDGRILYDRCFQCLDCVGVYHDARRCAPLVFHARTGREWRLNQASAQAPAEQTAD